jgi:hypothetical protein
LTLLFRLLKLLFELEEEEEEEEEAVVVLAVIEEMELNEVS